MKMSLVKVRDWFYKRLAQERLVVQKYPNFLLKFVACQDYNGSQDTLALQVAPYYPPTPAQMSFHKIGPWS